MTPITILTGFLGSGKTTLLNRLLHAPELRGALVLVNEFGEISLDHHLIESVDATFVLLDNGCLCCRVQSDLAEMLADMASKRRRGQVPAFDRVIVETTGMADPLPILQTIVSDPRVVAWYRLDRVITTLDGVLGLDTLERYEEAVRQVALADLILITKGDLASGSGERLEHAVRNLSADAPIRDARGFTPPDLRADLWRQPTGRDKERCPAGGHRHAARHTAGITARSVSFDRPVSWPAFAAWAQQLIEDRRGDILRLKAILNIAGRARPVVAHGVQHHFYPPGELLDWPDGDRRSRLVVIGRNLSQEELERRLDALLAAVPAG